MGGSVLNSVKPGGSFKLQKQVRSSINSNEDENEIYNNGGNTSYDSSNLMMNYDSQI